MTPRRALHLAVVEARICRERKMLLLRSWLETPTHEPAYLHLHNEYCDAKIEWQAAEARLYRVRHGDDGTHVRKIA